MAKMHELLAVEADLSNVSQAVLAETGTTFSKKPDHFKGQTRTVTFFDNVRERENGTETKALVTTVDDKLGYTLGKVGEYWDALFQKEQTNQAAGATLMVNGVAFAGGERIPATFLLGMETRLKAVRDVVMAVPTLDPNVVWTADPQSGEGVYRAEPAVSFKTEKQVKHKVLYDATDKHPAQIEKWNEDVPVARVETLHRSGMWSPARKAEVLSRIDTLLREVKKARQRANTEDVIGGKIADDMIKYILG